MRNGLIASHTQYSDGSSELDAELSQANRYIAEQAERIERLEAELALERQRVQELESRAAAVRSRADEILSRVRHGAPYRPAQEQAAVEAEHAAGAVASLPFDANDGVPPAERTFDAAESEDQTHGVSSDAVQNNPVPQLDEAWWRTTSLPQATTSLPVTAPGTVRVTPRRTRWWR